MSKEDIMNKISFALKDPILQMGFEVICSKLSRLEKENAELDCQMNRNKSCYSCANATDRCFRNEIGCPCEKYKSYKDENAELKEQIEKMKCCGNCKYWNYKDIQKYCNKRTGTPELAGRSFKCDKWELA